MKKLKRKLPLKNLDTLSDVLDEVAKEIAKVENKYRVDIWYNVDAVTQKK